MARKATVLVLSWGICASAAAGQQMPDSGALQNAIIGRALEMPVFPTNTVAKKRHKSARLAPKTGPTVLISRIVFAGNHAIPAQELKAIARPYTGMALHFSDLVALTAEVTKYYRAQGYLAVAYLPRQSLKGGLLRITVVEAKPGQVTIMQGQAHSRVNDALARKFLMRGQAPGKVLSLRAFNRAVQMLNTLPGVTAQAVLKKGGKPGTTDIALLVRKAPALVGSLQTDNYGVRSTGYGTGTLFLDARSPTGHGEEITLLALKSAGLRYANVAATVPLGYGGTRLGASLGTLAYSLGTPYQALQGTGWAQNQALTLSTPLISRHSRQLYATVQLGHRRYYNQTVAGITSHKQAVTAAVGLRWNALDGMFGGGATSARITLTAGNLILSGNATDLANDQATAKRNGGYAKLSFEMQRRQKLGGKSALQVTVRGQLAGKNLDPSEKVYLGGFNGVRAYPTNEAGGDSGMILRAQVERTLPAPAPNAKLVGFAFYDAGYVRLNQTTWTNWNSANPSLRNSYWLQGAGVGMRVKLNHRLELSGVLAERIGNNPGAAANGTDGDGTLQRLRLWVGAKLSF